MKFIKINTHNSYKITDQLNQEAKNGYQLEKLKPLYTNTSSRGHTYRKDKFIASMDKNDEMVSSYHAELIKGSNIDTMNEKDTTLNTLGFSLWDFKVITEFQVNINYIGGYLSTKPTLGYLFVWERQVTKKTANRIRKRVLKIKNILSKKEHIIDLLGDNDYLNIIKEVIKIDKSLTDETFNIDYYTEVIELIENSTILRYPENLELLTTSILWKVDGYFLNSNNRGKLKCK